jgi:hypothetical protein
MRILAGAIGGAFGGFLVWLLLAILFSNVSEDLIGVLYLVGLALVVFGAAAGIAFANRNAKHFG